VIKIKIKNTGMLNTLRFMLNIKGELTAIEMWHVVDGKWRHLRQELGEKDTIFLTDGCLITNFTKREGEVGVYKNGSLLNGCSCPPIGDTGVQGEKGT